MSSRLVGRARRAFGFVFGCGHSCCAEPVAAFASRAQRAAGWRLAGILVLAVGSSKPGCAKAMPPARIGCARLAFVNFAAPPTTAHQCCDYQARLTCGSAHRHAAASGCERCPPRAGARCATHTLRTKQCTAMHVSHDTSLLSQNLVPGAKLPPPGLERASLGWGRVS